MSELRKPPTITYEFPTWQSLYEAVVAETDCQRLPHRIADLEVAIFFRLKALANRSDDCRVEREAITDAGRTIRTLKQEKLEFPRWKNAG
jgi:hypothetical protein